MSDLDEFTETIFQELRDGVPILGTDGPLDVTGVDCLPDMHNLEELPRPYRLDLTSADLLPAEGSNEEAELMRILEVRLMKAIHTTNLTSFRRAAFVLIPARPTKTTLTTKASLPSRPMPRHPGSFLHMIGMLLPPHKPFRRVCHPKSVVAFETSTLTYSFSARLLVARSSPYAIHTNLCGLLFHGG